MNKGLPQAVLGERLGEAIAGRRVRTAVFTTFTFDPGFFELNVLPILFDRGFHQVEKLRRMQIEEALGSVREVAVYYDRSALAQDATPAQLNFDRIDVARDAGHGVFHPKLVMLLVAETGENEDGKVTDDQYETLIIGALSANLTRAGWWENVEAGHFEQISDRDLDDTPSPIRADVLQALRQIRDTAAPGEEHAALDRIHTFLTRRAVKRGPKRQRHGGRHYTRLFVGQRPLDQWLRELKLGSDWNLEIISPFFDKNPKPVLDRLYDAVQPRETRIWLPTDAQGAVQVSREVYEAIEAERGYRIFWAKMPEDLRHGSGKQTKNAPARRVHAKVYRFWRADGKQLMLVGSVNFTTPAHSAANTGNLEAAFLIDVTDEPFAGRWCLQTAGAEPTRFVEDTPDEADGLERVFIDLSVSYDWAANTLRYRMLDKTSGAVHLSTTAGETVAKLDNAVVGRWLTLPKSAADRVRELLLSTSFLEAEHGRGYWRVLVRETGMSHRPSLLTSLTPEEILMYWSLLSPTQREQFLLDKLTTEDGLTLEGLQTNRGQRYLAHDTLFDRFAGIYHAFEQHKRHLLSSLEAGDLQEVEARLFGVKYDSLPELLRKTIEQQADPVTRYLVVLCGRQLADTIRKADGAFWRDRRVARKNLETQLDRLNELERQLPLDGSDRAEFLAWYRTAFLQEAALPVD